MFEFLQVVSVVLVALAAAPVIAHALELPGKMRLSRDAYRTVQPIYYPGFTAAGGIGEAGGILALLVLLLATPRDSTAFLPTLVALLALVGMHAIYWIVTHPVNRYWLEGETLGTLSGGFFSFASRRGVASPEPDWTELRDRWEYSHLARAALAVLSLIAVVVAVS